MNRSPKIAILRWESGFVPQGLMQLETMAGNSTNPASYPFPVRLVEVKGACVETVITHPSKELLQRMTAICRQLKEEGIQAVTTSCGFNAIFQKELADNAGIPVFTSALLQVPFAQAMVGRNHSVGVITANRASLTRAHMEACNITDDMNLFVMGLEDAPQWRKIFDQPDTPFDMDAVSEEILGVARREAKEHPDLGAIVLECTDLPPYAARIRQELNVPVFDINSLVGYVAISLSELPLY